MRHYTIPVFIPELACPNRCVFCNQQKISGTCHLPGEGEIVANIESHLGTIPSNSHIELGFFGGNFTGISIENQRFFLSIAKPYIDSGQISSIRLSTRPDYIDLSVLHLLKEYKVGTIELGAQSLDEEVLLRSGRGHAVDDIEKAAGLILANGFQLGLQMMIGLPGDTKEKSLQTARRIIELGAHSTRIYPTLVIRDTVLENQFRNGEYTPLSLEDAIDWTKDLVVLFEQADVSVLRIGLHPSEGLLSGENLVAGPFHVAFGEMVASAVWREEFESYFLKNTQVLAGSSGTRTQIKIEVPVGQVNAAVGHRSSNKSWLLGYFSKIRIVENCMLKGREFSATFSGNPE